MKTVKSTRQLGDNHSTAHRLSLVAGACALALGASLAHAQTPTIPTSTYSLALTAFDPKTDPDSAVPATALQKVTQDNYMIWVSSPQLNSSTVTGTVETNPALMNIDLTGGGAKPASLTDNSATATAAGNQNTTTAALANITNPTGNLDGIGTLAAQVQLNGGTSALVDGTDIKITESGMLAAPATLTGNTLAASTTVNRSDTTVSGVVPVGYVSDAKGSINVDYAAATGITGTGTAPSATTTASVNLNTFQTNLDADSSAKVTDSAVQLKISATTTNTDLNKPLTVSSNTLSAQSEVNQSSNVFQASAGSAAFTGSVGVTNVQSNIVSNAVANTASSEAQVTGSSITSDITRGTDSTSLTGALVQSSNTISASASGNSAGERNAAGAILAGNAILLTSGADVTGTGSTTANEQTSAVGTATSNTQSDLALLNLQRNDNTNLTSSVTDGLITARADNVTTSNGSITLNSNAVASSAQGNLAGNLIEVIGTNSTATAAAANVQANSGTPIEASNSGSLVSVGVGYTGQAAAQVAVGGMVTLNQNSLSATTSGNASATNVVMLASNLTAQASTGAASVNVASGETTATAGLSATNLQSNVKAGDVASDIKASLGTAGVSALFTETGKTGAATDIPVALSGSTVSLDQNTLNATATGNSASTGVTLTGAAGAASNATVQAAVGNSQLNGLMTVSSDVSEAGVRTLGGAVTDSGLSVSSNTLASSAMGSSATNTLAANVTNLTVGTNELAAGAATVSTGAISTAALGLASVQINQAEVLSTNTTSMDTPFAGVKVSSATGSQLTVNSNQASANSTANSVSNTVQVIATNIYDSDTNASAIAALSNLQSNNVTGLSTVTVGASATTTTPTVGVLVSGDVTSSSTLTVSDNTLSAKALGNTGANQLAVTGTTLTSSVPTANIVGTSSTTPSGAVTSEFALTSRQVDTVSDGTSPAGRTATASDVVLGIKTTGSLGSAGTTPVAGGNFTVSNNLVSAEARNNQISNVASLTGFATLTTSAGLLNEQFSTTATTVAATGDVSIKAFGAADTTVVASKLDLSSNTVKALVVGNSAGNTTNINATNLTGNSGIATVGGSSYTYESSVGITATTAADFGTANVQTQSGALSATVNATQVIGLLSSAGTAADPDTDTTQVNSKGAAVTGGALTVNGNTAMAVAQANSAVTSQNLTGTNLSNLTGALLSVQTATAGVTATQTTGGSGNSFAVQAVSLDGTPTSVSNNAVLASAGMNEAFNKQNVSGTAVAANPVGGNGVSSYDLDGATLPISTGAAFSVQNIQSGLDNSTGVTASAAPGLIGVAVNDATASNLTVSNNAVTAKANVNYADNALNLAATNTLSGSGAVSNVQSSNVSSANGVKATIEDVSVGIAPPLPAGAPVPLNMTGGNANVTGNTLMAQAGGNTAVNALNASAVNGIASGGVASSNSSFGVVSDYQASNTATYAVLNYQGNASAMNATVQNASIGISAGGKLDGTTSTVQNNAVLASGYGNTASNSLGMSALTGNANAASAGISNVQYNLGAVTALVSNVSNGIVGAGVAGGFATVSGNSVAAQAVGNTAVNRIVALR